MASERTASGGTVTARLASLRAEDPYALHMLREHAWDAGSSLDTTTLATLRAHHLADADGALDEVLRVARRELSGHGLGIRLKRARRPKPRALARRRTSPVDAALDGAFAAGIAHTAQARGLAGVRALLDLKADRLCARKGPIDARAMARFCAAAATLCDARGAATPHLQRLLLDVEALFVSRMSRRAARLFFDLAASVGARVRSAAPPLPMRQVPYWLKDPHPLRGHRSSEALPSEADVVIIGAGMTGGSAALHIAEEARRQGKRVLLLEAGEVASQASGRNGGNLESIPESFFGGYGSYDGFVQERLKFLRASYPQLGPHALRAQAERIAVTLLRFGAKNAALLRDDIRSQKLAVDLSLAGWLRLALNTREETALRAEVKLCRSLGLGARLLSPSAIQRRTGLRTAFHGRLISNNGNFHPFKLVVQEVTRALQRGVLLHTHTPVTRVTSLHAELHHVETSRGGIRARKVVLATNAFTSALFPHLKDIRPFRSQIVNFAHVPNTLGGLTVTAKDGDIYGNFPRQDWRTDAAGHPHGTLHVGGGRDRPVSNPRDVRPSARDCRLISDEARQLFPALEGRVPLRGWAGPMAFVEGRHGMRLPVISPLGAGPERGVLVAVWCNGYGGTGCQKTGAEAARWALTGALSADVPGDVFGVQRLLSDQPMFDEDTGGPRR